MTKTADVTDEESGFIASNSDVVMCSDRAEPEQPAGYAAIVLCVDKILHLTCGRSEMDERVRRVMVRNEPNELNEFLVRRRFDHATFGGRCIIVVSQ